MSARNIRPILYLAAAIRNQAKGGPSEGEEGLKEIAACRCEASAEMATKTQNGMAKYCDGYGRRRLLDT